MRFQHVLLVLIILIMSLSVTWTFGSSPSIAAQMRKIVLTVKVTNAKSQHIPGVKTVIYQDGRELGWGVTDSRGIAQVDILVNSERAVVLSVEVSKGTDVNTQQVRLGTDFPARPPLVEITLKGGSSSRATAELTVLVTEQDPAGGKSSLAIKQALVNVYFGSYGDYIVRPPDFQKETDVSGIAKFDIPVEPGKELEITVVASREDKKSMQRTLNLGRLTKVVTFELATRVAEDTTGFPSALVKVEVLDNENKVVSGAVVRIQSDIRTNERTTGPDGVALVPIHFLTADSLVTFVIEVSKPGYKKGTKRFEVDNKWAKAVGKTFEPGRVYISRLVEGIQLKVTVRDGETGNPVSDADVILEGRDYATATTDTSGVASVSVAKPGDYKVRISQDYYWPTKDAQIHIVEGVPPDPVEFSLRRKATKDAAEDTIDITVLAKDSTDDTSPRPLSGAAVTDGRGTQYTNDQGQVTLHGAYDRAPNITVTAKDFESQTKRVPINKPLIGKTTGSATLVLEPIKTEQSPIRFVLEVRDAAKPNNLLTNAEVTLRLRNRKDHIVAPVDTLGAGERGFVLGTHEKIPLAELRKGITVDAWREGYERKYSDITPDLLQPSLTVQRVTIYLARDWSALRKSIEALEPKVSAWKNDVSAVSGSATTGFNLKAVTARREAERWGDEIYAAYKSVAGPAAQPTLCGDAAPYLMNIRSYEAQVKQKAQELKQRIDRATTMTTTCSTPAHAEMIRGEYRQAIKLTGEIGVLNNKAVKDRDALIELAKKNSAALDLLKEMKQKLAAITRLKTVAQENADNANALSQTLITRQLTLKGEVSVVSVKAFSEVAVPDDLRQRIAVMDAILKGANKVEALPKDVSETPQLIGDSEIKARNWIQLLERSTCNVPTLDTVVSDIDKILSDSTFEIGLAADLPQLADRCAAKAAAKNPSPTPNSATGDKDDAGISVQTDPKTDNKQPVFEQPDENKPIKPADQSTSSGGFWDAAKKAKQNVDDKITKKPGTNKQKGSQPENTAGNGPGVKTNKSANDDPANSGTESASNTAGTKPVNKSKKPAEAEDIPESVTGTQPANKRPESKNNKQGERNEPAANDSTAKNSKPGSGRGASPDNRSSNKNSPAKPTGENQAETVEEIPESAVKPTAGRGSGNPEKIASDKQREKADSDKKDQPGGNGSSDTTKKDPRSPGGPTANGNVDFSGRWVADYMVEGYAERKTIVLARSGPNEWEGNWRATGGPPFTEGTRRSDALLRIRIVSDGNGKAHYFVNDVTEQNPMSYTANEILVSYRTYIRQR